MKTPEEPRADAQRMQEFALGIDDPEVLTEIHLTMEELECQARALEGGEAQKE
jgi:hypothetical protein